MASSILNCVCECLGGFERVVLAVSGGIDSMALLDAAARVVDPARLIVATFDHGTGTAAVAASELVQERATELGVQCFAGKANARLESEAEFRHARWSFLRRIADERGAVIATAHTQDDQIETVLMRVLRGAGARGLPGLYAQGRILRPLIDVRRVEVVGYAAERGLRWIEDPSNRTPVYLRNRVRADLLPALRRVSPSIDAELLSVARNAAQWRDEVESLAVDAMRATGGRVLDGNTGMDIPASAFAIDGADHLSGQVAKLLWPAFAARIGIALDRRGLERLVRFTESTRVGRRMPLPGGWTVVRGRSAFAMRPARAESSATVEPLALSDDTTVGAWRFHLVPSEKIESRDVWSAWLPDDAALAVRPWQPGDAMQLRMGGTHHKVKRLLSAAGVTGHERTGWPVVLSGTEIIWVPGVRRAAAATARSGRPGLAFTCEYNRC